MDQYYHRVKIKAPEYVAKHHAITGVDLSKRRILDILCNHPELEKEIEENLPESRVYFAYYKFKMEEVRASLVKCCLYAKDSYEEYDHNRDAVYREIGKNLYSREAMKFLTSSLQVWDYAESVFISYRKMYLKPYAFDKIDEYRARFC